MKRLITDKVLHILVENLSFSDYILATKDISDLEVEIERLNNIIEKLEQENAVLKTQVVNKDEYSYGIRSGAIIPPEAIGTNGEDGGLFDYGDR